MRVNYTPLIEWGRTYDAIVWTYTKADIEDLWNSISEDENFGREFDDECWAYIKEHPKFPAEVERRMADAGEAELTEQLYAVMHKMYELDRQDAADALAEQLKEDREQGWLHR